MFVIIKPQKPCGGLFETHKMKKELEKKSITACRTPQGMPFAVLEVFCGKKGIDWECVEDKCGRYISRLILPSGISPPEKDGFACFIPAEMPAILNFNTALKAFEFLKLPPDMFTLSVADSGGRFPENIERLIPFCSAIKIITACPEKFVSVCSEIYKNYGASVMLRPVFEKSSKYDIVICCDERSHFNAEPDAVFSFSSKNTGRISVTGSGIKLLPEHEKIIFTENGTEFDSVTFAAALTELCGFRDYRNSSFQKINLFSQNPDIKLLTHLNSFRDVMNCR